MSTLVKTVQTEPLVITKIDEGTNYIGTAIDVSTKFAGTFLWDFAAIDAQATPVQTEFAIQASQKDTGNDAWVNLFTWLSSSAASATAARTAGGTAGVSTITLDASISATANVYFFMLHGTIASSEWCRRIGESGTYVVTVEDAFTNDQSASAAWTIADRYKFDVDFSSIRRVRVCINNNRGTNVRDVVCRVALITADSIL